MTTKWAVVTGAGKGIGAVIAGFAVKAGYQVAAWDIDGDAVAAVGAEIGAVASRVDVADEASVQRAVDALPQAPELLVNSAGLVRFGPLLELSLADWELAMRVNVTGTFVVGRTVARRMAAAGGGSIVNLASINGIAAALNAGAYSTTKAGVAMLSEHMAMEWAGLGIRVNTVAPGLINAGMSDAIYADPEVRSLREARVPLGRLGSAEDVAEIVLFLGSEKASYITGQLIAVDGGITKGALLGLARPKSVDSVGRPPAKI